MEALETAYVEVVFSQELPAGSVTPEKTRKMLQGKAVGQTLQEERRQISVQFNPSKLNFHMCGTGYEQERADISRKEKQSDREKTTTVLSNDTKAAVVLEIALIFDRSIYQDSSVQPEAEQFLAVIKNPYVRQMAFYWGSMSYQGIVESVELEYVLFNRNGIPTRAVVHLNMEVLSASG